MIIFSNGGPSGATSLAIGSYPYVEPIEHDFDDDFFADHFCKTQALKRLAEGRPDASSAQIISCLENSAPKPNEYLYIAMQLPINDAAYARVIGWERNFQRTIKFGPNNDGSRIYRTEILDCAGNSIDAGEVKLPSQLMPLADAPGHYGGYIDHSSIKFPAQKGMITFRISKDGNTLYEVGLADFVIKQILNVSERMNFFHMPALVKFLAEKRYTSGESEEFLKGFLVAIGDCKEADASSFEYCRSQRQEAKFAIRYSIP